MIEDGPRRHPRKPRRGDLPIATIAELAGVSPPTVSKVLNGRGGVGEQTRRRVEALLRDHGYRRRQAAGATPCVEVVFHQMLPSIAMEILRGVQQVAGARDCTVGFTDVHRRVLVGQSWVEPMLRRQPTAVITVLSQVTAEHSAQFAASGVPLVAVDPIGDLFPTPAVGANNWSGALAGTRHLLDLGHRRIGVLTGPVKDLSARARLDGFRAALDYAGIPFDDGLERRGVFTFDSGRELAAELLSRPAPPTAVVCGNDLQALGVYAAAREADLRIPDDLSVVGFDDIDQAAWLAPPLTTVRQPFGEIGATAARLALSMADGHAPAQERYELNTALVVRGSTAPPRAG
ncbi:MULTISPECIES: LacI family DNA-binding transcriptional regulator [unclassified Micromonospora]|uniref:LacI family DNA-binding transcriptional regulator n=1 Tax=unclassified Micromonospora TaxID=2617518 RepID=UPI00098D5CEC|nr:MULTISPECIES: LacI family DNA-binding transcriptional regulator [unclassified Micromonospora]MDI5939248.1 LacI family DNA-binding transcriptional regulator [Micromonospora sp. DH15]OON27910.1 LacI family transcriptional regulator [Micromonospora sp. Rc5]